MRIILFSRPQIAHTTDEIRQLVAALQLFGFDWLVNEEFAPVVAEKAGVDIPAARTYGYHIGPQPPETIMVCYGGDGTLLEGVHRLGGEPVPVMGINAGHLGFLTTAPNSGLDLIFREIAERRACTCSVMTLESGITTGRMVRLCGARGEMTRQAHDGATTGPPALSE